MKRIIIIGATSGIGLEVARCYLKTGWQVGVAGRREEELEKLRQSAPGQVCTQRIDVTREDAPALLEQLIMKTGGMDVFLLSSGIGKQNLSLCPDIELQTAATNVSGFIRMVNAAYHYFEQQGKGHIAVISSIAGTKGLGSAPAYSATKRFQNTYRELEDEAKIIKNELLKIKDVAKIEIYGIQTPTIDVSVSPSVMAQSGITTSDIASAGLKGLQPNPPKVILPTPIATNAPMIIIQSGKLEGRLNASNTPVIIAEPSQMVERSLFKINLVIAHSKNTQAATEVKVTTTAPSPNI